MAPVACGVAYGQKDRFVLEPCFLERFRTPRIPVHGVMGVLLKVGALLVDQAIRMHSVHYRKP
jgi:hypothetical protein